MLNKLRVKGYRLLDDFTADFGALTVVIGANATGKSTLLDCLRFIGQITTFELGETASWHGGLHSMFTAHRQTDEIGLRVEFDNQMKETPWDSLPPNRTLAYEVRLGQTPSGQPQPKQETLRFLNSSASDPGEGRILETAANQSLILNKDGTQLLPFDQTVDAKDTKSAEGASRTAAGLGLTLAKMRFFNEFPLASAARFALNAFQIFPAFDVSPNSKIRGEPAEIAPGVYLFFNGGNLGAVLHDILTRYEYREVAERIREFMQAAYPSFEEITAETAYGGTPVRVLIRIREKGMSRGMDLWDISDGMLRFLCLATALLAPSLASLVALDEPEAGLHPMLLPIVGDMIKTASEKTQVIVTTHSPDLLNCFGLDDIAVISREKERAIWGRPGTRESLRTMLQNVTGETLGDLHRTGELEAMAP
jgi:predicted ATPase